MKPISIAATLLVIATSVWAYQNVPPQESATAGTQTTVHGIIPARLSKALDSNKAKPNDEVVATTTAPFKTGDGMVVPNGSKVLGHVTEVTTPSKGDVQSSIGMVFDKIELGHGKEIKIQGTVQAIAPGTEVDTGAGGSGTIPQLGLDPGTMPPPSTPTASNSSKDAMPTLNAQSKGVVGFRDLGMGLDSLLTSNAKRIRLNAGTQMMLRVQFE